MNNKVFLSTLFRKSDDKINMKTQGGFGNKQADSLVSKSKQLDQKLPKIKQDENAVSKLLNKIKIKKENQMDILQKDSKPKTYRNQTPFLVAEPIEIESSPQISVEFLYNKNYGDEMEKSLYFTMPDFSNSLKFKNITERRRAMMVNWMIEVLANYNQTTSNQTLFLAVAIMDLYFKHSKEILSDSDVHVSGICAMFLASKYDDIYHIPLEEFIASVGHYKYSAETIKQKEWDIVSALDFNVNIPTYLDYLGRIIYNNFQDDDSNNLESIRETTIYVLKMCLHHYDMLQFPPKILVYSALCYSVKCLFNDLIESSKEKGIGDTRQIQIQEASLLKSILNSGVMSELIETQRCTDAIKDLAHNFKKKHPNLINIDRFSQAFQG